MKVLKEAVARQTPKNPAEGVAGRYFEKMQFERLHPEQTDAAVYHGREHTASVADMTYAIVHGREFTANDRSLLGTKNAKAEFLSEVALLHDIDPTRVAGKPARVPATLAWMGTPEAIRIMQETFGWNAQKIEMAKAMIQRTEFPFDGAKVGEKTALGFPRGKTATFEADAKIGDAKGISEHYANMSPVDRYVEMVGKLDPAAREFVIREAPVLSEFADKGSTYFKKPGETLRAVEGLGNEATGKPESFMRTTDKFLGDIGNAKNFEVDVKIAERFGIKTKYPAMEDVMAILPSEQIANWKANRNMFKLVSEGMTTPQEALKAVTKKPSMVEIDRPVTEINDFRAKTEMIFGTGGSLRTDRMQQYNGEVFTIMEGKMAEAAKAGKRNYRVVFDIDAKGLGQANKTMGRTIGDAKLTVTETTIYSEVSSRMKEGESVVLTRVGGDEYRLVVSSSDAAIAQRIEGPLKNLPSKFKGISSKEIEAELVRLGVAEADAKLMAQATNGLRHKESAFGFKIFASKTELITTENAHGTIMRGVGEAERSGMDRITQRVQERIGLEGKTASQIKVPKELAVVSPNERVSGNAYRISLALDDLAMLKELKNWLPEREKALVEIHTNSFRNRGGNTIWGEVAQNYVGTELLKSIAEVQKNTGCKIRFTGDFQIVVEGGNVSPSEMAALIQKTANSSFKKSGLKLSTNVINGGEVANLNPAEIDVLLTGKEMNRTLTINSINAAETLVSVFEGGSEGLARYYLGKDFEGMSGLWARMRKSHKEGGLPVRNPSIRDFSEWAGGRAKELRAEGNSGEAALLNQTVERFFDYVQNESNARRIVDLKEGLASNIEKIH